MDLQLTTEFGTFGALAGERNTVLPTDFALPALVDDSEVAHLYLTYSPLASSYRFRLMRWGLCGIGSR